MPTKCATWPPEGISNADAARAAPQDDDWKKQALDDAQGDIAIGLPKNNEEFFFFTVQDIGKFKRGLASLDVANGRSVLKKKEEIRAAPKGQLVKAPFLNIAFSSKGLAKLGLPDLDKLEDPGPLKSKFKNGQLASAESLGDSGKTVSGKFDPDWETAFKNPLDGLILIAAESEASIAEKRDHYRTVFGDSLREEYTLKGTVRPGENRGHEHFGWLDDISNPAITGLGVDGKGTIIKGQTELDPGALLCSQKGDSKTDRPAWAKNGSFLVFRQLAQKVPEFHQFLVVTAATALNDPSPQGAHRLGAHLVGRWKSGAPLLLAPKEDNEKLGKDKDKNNVFTFPTGTGDEGQALCPYSAHIRKTNPRNDITPSEVRKHSIRRAGITYGPEVSPSEQAEKVTKQERGLAFVCYQSDLADGFDFMQRLWCNNSAFPFQKKVKPDPGLDPLIGQKVVNGKRDRETWGTAQGSKISGMPEFVNSRGGEYFFSPSLSTLKNVMAKK